MARINDLNALEQARAELAAGRPMTDLDEPDAPKAMLLGALAWQRSLRDLGPDDTRPTFEVYMASTDLNGLAGYLFGDDDDEQAAADPFRADEGVAADGGGGDEGGVLSGDGDRAE